MKANEARELATKNVSGPVIEPILNRIYHKIRGACGEGKTSIVHPLQGLGTYPSAEVQKALWQHLSAVDGYQVTHHPDPDPGDVRSGPYTEISWK